MPSFADLCIQAPLISHGVPSGLDFTNIAVEVAMPTGGALLGDDASQPGTFILGTSTLSAYSWYDATERMQGVQIERGGSPGDRPEPGTATIQLDNTDKDLSPWSQDDYFLGIENPFLGPGTLVRVTGLSTLATSLMAYLDLFKTSDFTVDAGITNTGALLKYPFTFGSPFAATSAFTLWDLTSATVQIETDKFPSGNSTSLFCYFGVYKTSGATDDYIEISKTPAGNMTFNITKAHTSSIVTLAGCQHRFWQIREDSGTVYVETSAEGFVWTVQHSAPTPNGMTACKVKVHNANSGGAGANLTDANGWWVTGVNTRQLAGEWFPLFTGLVESWEDTREALNGTGSVMVTAIETLSVLAQYDINALGAVVGLGDTFTQRVQRLGDAADWAFGYDDQYTGNFDDQSFTYQSTDMAQNRLTELYLTADSTDALLYSGKDGRLKIIGRTFNSMTAIDVTAEFDTLGALASAAPANVDDLTTKNDDALIIGKVTLARVGGTELVTNNTFLSTRFQPRTYTRNDLITQNPGADEDLTYVASQILDRSDSTFRADSIVIDGKRHDNAITLILNMDVGKYTFIYAPDLYFNNVYVAAYTLRIAPLNDLALDITADLQFEPGHGTTWGLPFW